MNIREEIIESIKREVLGPDKNNHYVDEETNEEILVLSVHGSPKMRYGAGMLYPQQATNKEITDTPNSELEEDPTSTEENSSQGLGKNKRSSASSGMEYEEEPVGMANQYLPSAMGFTIRFRSEEHNDEVSITIKSAYYEKGKGKKVKKQITRNGEIESVNNKKGDPFESDYWIRRPINPDPQKLKLYTLFDEKRRSFNQVLKQSPGGGAWLTLRVYNRSTPEDIRDGYITYTFVLINSLVSNTDDSSDANKILFQNELLLETDNDNLIVPYKEKVLPTDTEEEKIMNLLYRKKRVYSIGHGTSVNWDVEQNQDQDYEIVKRVETSVIPTYELPQVAPTSHVFLSMLELSDFGDWETAKSSLLKLKEEYSKWIDTIRESVHSSEFDNYREAALINILKCETSLSRIKKGIDLLVDAEDDSHVVRCFRWMNRAMIWQQQRSKSKLRRWIKTGVGNDQKLILEYLDEENKKNGFESLVEYHEGQYNGKWRPFQIAFILMNIESIVNPSSQERSIVDLIWFPTGGGKTEAYLGLTAFTIFYRRIKGNENKNWNYFGGTGVIMRYTLRLLTTQQYERAASLICACDLIRRENKEQRESELIHGELGDEPISIGLWVGRTSTPNEIAQAQLQFRKLKNDINAEYNFVVMKCPCCGSQIGKVNGITNRDRVAKIKGLRKEDGNGKVFFQCENQHCEYSDIPLPLQVIDEIIYAEPPTLLLGTVDKFAMIPWKKNTGKLFGFRKDNEHEKSRILPPDLIIQDELHLISGPLGTMVGLYESMVQTLCNNYNLSSPPFIKKNTKFIPPKIVASSATISRAFEQVQNLYGIQSRDQLSIFPAQGLHFGDTWFSEEKSLSEKDENGSQKFPGRMYTGILASGYPSAQTAIVRTYAMVLQKIKELSDPIGTNKLDYYWTLLGYFNSIRELGGASSLVYGDIKERLGQIQNRDLVIYDKRRYVNKIEELTSRISSSEIPATLKKLETKYQSNNNSALDICLATNMVATGVDISRLGLMFIHGQPKTTAEYIQASSRVGRDIPKGPGLILTLFSPSKPRDKSQYEQFQAFHSRIYSYVEPTSVTPYSINARQKGIHAVLIGLVRHFATDSLSDHPIITNEFDVLVEQFSQLLLERCQIVDPDECVNLKLLLDQIINDWREGGAEEYGDAGNYKILSNEGFYPLMYSSSAEVREDVTNRRTPFSTPSSMRGVDTESVLSINSSSE